MAQFKRFNPEESVKPFDCGDADLNGFLLEDDPSVSNARHHANELLAVTYVIEDEEKEQTIAYFSLLNDKIEREITDNAAWNRLAREIPNIKRRKSQPAVKIGRLAVSSAYQGQGWGSRIIAFLGTGPPVHMPAHLLWCPPYDRGFRVPDKSDNMHGCRRCVWRTPNRPV